MLTDSPLFTVLLPVHKQERAHTADMDFSHVEYCSGYSPKTYVARLIQSTVQTAGRVMAARTAVAMPACTKWPQICACVHSGRL